MNNMKHKILMTLALLITAVGGAWAEKVTVTFTQADLNCTGTVAKDGVTLTPSTGDAHSYTNLYDFGSTTFSVDKGKFTKIEIVDCSYGSISGWQTEQTGSYQPEPVDAPDYWVNLYTLTWTGEAESVTFTAAIYDIQSIVCTINKPDVDLSVDVTLNEAKTEATMDMPTSDVTVDYELVRDMSINMTTTIGDGNDGYRIRLKKSEQIPGKFVPADMTLQEMMALIKVHDAIENQDLTFGIPGANCWVNIYAANENNQAEGNPIALQDLTPGRYIAKAVAAENSAYDGETAMSNIFELFEGFEVVVPAGEYATFYKDEPLYADPVTSADAELYTITSVSGDKAILSNALETAPSRTPLLVYNKGTEEKTFLLIPANAEPNLALDVYDGFIGTMQPTVIPASNATTDNYAFNGKQFVWVMNEIAIGANKAWLSIPKTNGNPKNIRIYRGNGEATGIDESIVNSEDMNSVWYDLNGRKLQGKPSLKGVYIKNGKKVIVP